jgi:hypothetical protein
MQALDDLTAAFEDMRATAGAAAEHIHYLVHDLAAARAEAADAAALAKMAADLRATADALRAALAAIGQAQPQR